jgi:hypothetical protein
MKSLYDYLNESSKDVLKPKKGKWTEFDPDKLSDEDKAELEDEFIDLIKTAYAPIGGHVNFKDKEDVFKSAKINYWKGIDLHGSPDVDVILFGKKTKYGIKYVGVGHDGEKDSKREYLASKAKDLAKTGFYNELSGVLAEIMLKKFKLPAITNKEDIEKVLGKDIKYFGKHPDGKTEGDGWYEREIGGQKHTKILIGKPKK